MMTWRSVLLGVVLTICLVVCSATQERAAPAATQPAATPAAAPPAAAVEDEYGDAVAAPAVPPAAEPPAAPPTPPEPLSAVLPVAMAPDAPAPVEAARPLSELQQRLKTRVSVDFREAPIEDVIRTFAEQGNIDIVKAPTVTGKVTATLTDVPMDEAMDSILGVHGYGYMTTETIVRVVPAAELKKREVKLLTRIYRIHYADLQEMQKTLKTVLSSHGRITVNPETRHLAIIDTEEQIAVLDKMIEEMDHETPQILVEAKIYDVSCSAFFDFGFNWSAGTMTLYDAQTGMAIGGEPEPFTQSAFSSAVGQAPKGTFGLRMGVVNENLDLDVMFRAVKDNVKARLLASPKILVLNARQANIKIVSELPYQELTQTSGGGNIGTTKFKDVGVTLTVTPHVTRDNKVRLTLRPEFSVQTGTVPIVIPAGLTTVTSAQPIVDKREAMTETLIADGQTVVIGGLRKKDVVREVSKVPLLGDIPLVGELFKFRGDKTVNSELIVFITPRIITDPTLAPDDARKLDLTNSELTEPDGPERTTECSACPQP